MRSEIGLSDSGKDWKRYIYILTLDSELDFVGIFRCVTCVFIGRLGGNYFRTNQDYSRISR